MWDAEPKNILKFFPQKNITHKIKVDYYNNYLPVPEKEYLACNVKCTIFQHRFLNTYTLVSHRRHVHKNTPPFINIIASDTNLLSYLSIFQTVMTLQCILLCLTLGRPI